ncbi:MAG: Cache 3/Cache 2 fusion domain-containing protein [Myxococcota bacterium]
MKKYNATLLRALTVLLPVLCLLALLGGYMWQLQQTQTAVIDYLQQQIDKQDEEIDTYIGQNKNNLEKLASNRAFKKLMLLKKSPDAEQQLNSLLSRANSSFKFDDIFIVSKDKKILFQLSDNKKTDLTKEEVELFQKTITLMGTSISKLHQNSVSQGVHALLATPFTVKHKLAGVVMASVGSAQILKMITQREQNNPYPFETVLGFTQNQQLRVLYNAGRAFGLSTMEQIVDIGSPQLQGLQQALHGNQGAGKSGNRQGEITLAAWRYSPHANLAILATLKQQSLFSSIRNAYLLAAAAVLLLNVAFIWLARRKDRTHALYHYTHAPQDDWHQQAKWSLNGFLWTGIAITACSIGFSAYHFMQIQNRLHTSLQQEAKTKVQQATQMLQQHIHNIQNAGYSMSADLSSGQLKKQDIILRLKSIVRQQPDVFGIGVAYSPYSYKSNVRLYAPYIHREGDRLALQLVQKFYDYTLPESLGRPKTDWYSKPMSTNQAMWTNPYFDTAGQQFISSYVVPFYRPDDREKKHPIGTVEVLQDLDSLRNLVSKFNLHGTGYNFIVDTKGTYIYHPIDRYIKKQFSIQNTNSVGLTAVKEFANHIAQAQQSNKISMYGKGPSWVYTKYIPQADWIFGIAFEESDLQTANRTLKYFMTIILISMFLLILFAAGLILHSIAVPIDRAAAYFTVFTGSALLTLMGFWGYMLLEPPHVQLKHSTPMLARVEINRYVTSFRKARTQNLNTVAIPTGLVIRDIRFIDFKYAVVSGYCWQKYPIGANIKQGVVIAGATKADFQEIYREQQKDIEVVGWEFTAAIAQNNNHWRYPFDDQNITIMLENTNLDANAILTPDADSYDLLYPQSKPGIDPALLQSISIQKSFFAYAEQKPRNTLGLDENSHLVGIPNLVYHIAIKRAIIDPIAFYCTPLIIALLCLYMLFMVQKKVERGKLIGAYLTVLFTVVLLHQILRKELKINELIYMEHFFLFSYIMMVAIFSNVFFASTTPPITWVNRYLRLTFWPATLTAWIISTVYVFLR